MGLLSNVIPGLRDFRTPFASGLLWLLFGFLVFHDDFSKANAPDLNDLVSDLQGALKPFGLGALLSISAYLLGTALELTWNGPLKLLPQLSPRGLRSIRALVAQKLDALPDEELVFVAVCHPALGGLVDDMLAAGGPVSPRQLRRMQQRLQALERRRRFREAEALSRAVHEAERELRMHGRPDQDESSELTVQEIRQLRSPRLIEELRERVDRSLQASVRGELDIVATRLIGGQNDLFQLFDRFRAESEFRAAIAVPLTLTLFVVLNSFLPFLPVVLLSAIVFVVFVAQASSRRVAAGDRIADALKIGDVVKAPSLEPVAKGVFTEVAYERGDIRQSSTTLSEELERLGVSRFQRILYRFAAVIGGGRYFVTELIGVAFEWVGDAFRAVGRLLEELEFAGWDLVANRGRIVRGRRRIRRNAQNEKVLKRQLGDLYRDAGEWSRAQKEYGQANTVEAMDASMDLALELSYRQFVQRESPVALMRLADLLAEQERLAEARFVCEDAIDSGFTFAYVVLGDVWRALGKPKEAEQAYRSAIRAGHAVALLRLSQFLIRRKRLIEAERMLRLASVAGLETAGPVLASVRNALAEKRLQGRRPASTSEPAFKVEQLPDQTIAAEAPPAPLS